MVTARAVYPYRGIAKAFCERVDFMAVTALNQRKFRTVSDFCKHHLEALEGLFVQVLRLCQKAGLMRLGHVALDGTEVKACASKHKAMSYGGCRRPRLRSQKKRGAGSKPPDGRTPRMTVGCKPQPVTNCPSGSQRSGRASRRSKAPDKPSRPKHGPRRGIVRTMAPPPPTHGDDALKDTESATLPIPTPGS